LRSNWMLRRLFSLASRGVPLSTITDVRRPRALPTKASNEPAHEPEPALRRSYGGSGS
jgi:hypothetical protein